MDTFFKNKIFLAPMAGITDAPMRRVVMEETDGQISLVSEMVAVNAISYKNAKTYKIADVRNENYPVIVQLMGSDPALFAEAAKLVSDLGASGIDINMGCPVRKIISSGAGSALMKDEKLASRIIEATVKATSLPVSVKFRKGFDNEHINAVFFAKMCENSGARFVTIHGRTKTQGYSGQADWDIIYKVKSNVNIPVIGNGDVSSPQKAHEMFEQTGVDAVMIGRAALGNPWLLKNVVNFMNNKPLFTPSPHKIYDTLLRHMAYLNDYYGSKIALGLSRKYVCWYCKKLYDAKKFRETYMHITDFDLAMKEIQSYFENQVLGEEQ